MISISYKTKKRSIDELSVNHVLQVTTELQLLKCYTIWQYDKWMISHLAAWHFLFDIWTGKYQGISLNVSPIQMALDPLLGHQIQVERWFLFFFSVNVYMVYALKTEWLKLLINQSIDPIAFRDYLIFCNLKSWSLIKSMWNKLKNKWITRSI